MSSKRQMQARIVWCGRRLNVRLMNAHEKAPTTPAVVAMTLMRPRASAGMCSCVLA